MFDGTFFVFQQFRRNALRLVVLRSTPVRAGQRFPEPLAPLPFNKRVRVWACKIRKPHTHVFVPTSHKVFYGITGSQIDWHWTIVTDLWTLKITSNACTNLPISLFVLNCFHSISKSGTVVSVPIPLRTQRAEAPTRRKLFLRIYENKK